MEGFQMSRQKVYFELLPWQRYQNKNTYDNMIHFCQFTLSLVPENIRKSYGLLFSGGRERMHWEKMI